MADIANAISAAMIARRWLDLPAAMQVYARRFGVLSPGRLFNGTITHQLVRHALTLTDSAQFDAALAGVASALGAVRAEQPLADAIQDHRRMHEHYEAFQRFAAIVAAEEEIH